MNQYYNLEDIILKVLSFIFTLLISTTVALYLHFSIVLLQQASY